MTEWQPIETAPKDGTLIDIWDGKYRKTDVRWMKSEDYPLVTSWCALAADFETEEYLWTCITEWGLDEPTHWMPLPPPPKEKTDEANSCPTCHDKTYVVDGVVVGECPACEKGGVR